MQLRPPRTPGNWPVSRPARNGGSPWHARRKRSRARSVRQPASRTERKARSRRNSSRLKPLCWRRKTLDAPGESYTSLRGSLKTVENNLESEASRNKPFPTTSSGRRSALARWLTQTNNPLTARVAVNHIWARHFGKPLVPTIFDFGRKGQPPTHPPLLDWLAVEFMDRHWSMKHLHRLIVTSSVYRLASASAGAEANRASDPENRWYWRMNSVRMEAEVVRDSLLHLAGELDSRTGGPSIPVGDETSRRKSLYFVHSHNEHHRFLSVFDDASVLECYRRVESIVPQQALALQNSRLALTAAEKIADRLNTPDRVSDASFVKAAFEAILAVHAHCSGTGRMHGCPEGTACPRHPRETARSRPPSPRYARWCAAESQRLRDDTLRYTMKPDCDCGLGIHRRSFLADMGMGFTGLVLGALFHEDGIARASDDTAVDASRRQTAFSAEGEERDLAVHERRRQPPGELRPQADAHEVRWQDDRRDSLQGYPGPRKAQTRSRCRRQRRQRPAAQPTSRHTDRLPEARQERHRGQRLVPAPRRVASTTSPSFARCTPPTTTTALRRSFTPAGTCSTASSPRSAPGSITAWARSTTTCRSSSRWAAREYWNAKDGHYLGPRHDAVPLAHRPEQSARLRQAGEGPKRRRAEDQFRPRRPAQPAARRSSIPTIPP